LIATDQSADRPPQLVTVDLVGERPEATRLRRVGDRVFDTPEPMTADVRRFRITNTDQDEPAGAPGHRVDAWLLVPPGAREPLPTVLMIHGGPNAAFGEAFSLDAQALCGAGFGVLYANPRGSTGSGDVFTHAVHGDWGGGPVHDLLAVLDHCIDLGWVDGDRVGVTGNSYGGYLTAWLACTTDRFRAAVAENPVTDLLSMYGTSDIGQAFLPGHLGATPTDDPAAYLRWSPIMHAHRCVTPMLFVVGADDRRCPPTQSFELHRALHAHGVPSEILVLPGEAHEGTTYGSPAARLAHDDALVEWMERWLLG
jgi:dipeptidyl aminopeptidase/acylaminoacyl peptidase